MQIQQHNVRHTKIIAIKNRTILEKDRKKRELLEGIADIIAQTKVAQASSLNDFAGRYKWEISNVNLNTAKKLWLTEIKKY